MFACLPERAENSCRIGAGDTLSHRRQNEIEMRPTEPKRPSYFLEIIGLFAVLIFMAHYLGLIAKHLGAIAEKLQ
jgi:hypothetical protein